MACYWCKTTEDVQHSDQFDQDLCDSCEDECLDEITCDKCGSQDSQVMTIRWAGGIRPRLCNKCGNQWF